MATTFEFTAEQNAALQRLADRMRFVGAGLVILGTLVAAAAALAGAPVSIPGIAAALVLGASGYWTVDASRELRGAALTEGDDVGHVLAALRRIGRLYDLQYWLLIAGILVVAVTILAS